MSNKGLLLLFLCAVFVLSGCATYHRRGLDPLRAQQIERTFVRREFSLSRELEDRILALDPGCVTERDIREVLSQAPAPRIINIHGGIYPVHRRLISFSEFLMGMGYPGASIINPGDGTYTFSCYESSEKIAGVIAWYYEKEGLRPMMVGHSQGGIQVVKVLHKLAAHSAKRRPVWNPLTWKREKRYDLTDPLSGQSRPVVGLQLPYAAAVGAGGLTRLLPNQWDMCGKLRTIPDSVEEFSGFYKGMDLLGGDYLGYGPANLFKPTGKAQVRNIQLPSEWKHGAIPDIKHLLKSQETMDRINHYKPSDQAHVVVEANPDNLNPDTLYLFWAEDVWYSIKKHWVIELQRLIQSKRKKEK